MRDLWYPYSGAAKARKTTKEDKPEFVVFPTYPLGKILELLKHRFQLPNKYDNATLLFQDFILWDFFCHMRNKKSKSI